MATTYAAAPIGGTGVGNGANASHLEKGVAPEHGRPVQNGLTPGGHAIDNSQPGFGNGIGNGGGYNSQGKPMQHAVTPGGHALDNTQPAFPVYHRRFANPAPLGLCAFATTTFVLSMVNVNTRNLNTLNLPNIVVGIAFGYGGLVQLLAGMWEFAAGNTLGATAFSSYGGFWISFAAIFVPWFGILDAYGTNVDALTSALGIYLAAWMIFTFIMLLSALRSSMALISVFFFLWLTLLLLMAGEFTGSTSVHIAGGALGLVTAFCAWYTALTGLLTPSSSYFLVPAGDLSSKD